MQALPWKKPPVTPVANGLTGRQDPPTQALPSWRNPLGAPDAAGYLLGGGRGEDKAGDQLQLREETNLDVQAVHCPKAVAGRCSPRQALGLLSNGHISQWEGQRQPSVPSRKLADMLIMSGMEDVELS